MSSKYSKMFGQLKPLSTYAKAIPMPTRLPSTFSLSPRWPKVKNISFHRSSGRQPRTGGTPSKATFSGPDTPMALNSLALDHLGKIASVGDDGANEFVNMLKADPILVPAAVFGRRAGAEEHNAMERIVGRDIQYARRSVRCRSHINTCKSTGR